MSTITIRRTWSDDMATLGLLYVSDSNGIRQQAYTLEDPHQDHKILGRTRIPEGNYILGVRKTGRWAGKFQEQGFPGSIEIADIPGFTDVLIHWGNEGKDTEGCPLVGYSSRLGYSEKNPPFLGSSKRATLDLYRILFQTPGYSWRCQIENWEHQ